MQPESVGEIVRLLRGRRGLEQVELARACGWRDASAVSRIETNRIRPTRRTLNKIADALADGAVAPEEVRSMLYGAAGHLPTAADVARAQEALPDLSEWPQPAVLMDFGWHVWRANQRATALLGLPRSFAGRNYLEMLFEDGGAVRESLGTRWEATARYALRAFRAETAGRTGQRWYRRLLETLEDSHDFAALWTETTATTSPMHGFTSEALDGGSFNVVRLTAVGDARLAIYAVLPADVEGARSLERTGALLR